MSKQLKKRPVQKELQFLASFELYGALMAAGLYFAAKFILDSGLHQKNPLKPQGFGGFSDDDGEMFPLFYPYCAVSLNRRQHS